MKEENGVIRIKNISAQDIELTDISGEEATTLRTNQEAVLQSGQLLKKESTLYIAVERPEHLAQEVGITRVERVHLSECRLTD